MKIPVSLLPAGDYHPAGLKTALTSLLEPLGGMTAFVRPGQKVLIKPNMLAGKPPDKAVTTHPELVRQVILQVREAGGNVLVGDSPGLGKPDVVAHKCGLMQVIEQTGAKFAPFVESVPLRTASGIFHQLEVAREAIDAEVIINLPKLKTHQMMGFTGGVKNLFGLVVGMRKARLHLQAGTDKEFFALMLLELAEKFPPALTILDGILGMEGDGPGSGDPVATGVLLASPNPLALDTAAVELLGLRPDQVWTQRVAVKTGRFGCRREDLDLHGPPLEELRPPAFRPSKSTDVNFGLPELLRRPLKNSLTARPVPDVGKCRLCGDCVTHCPPRAMQIRGGRLQIDYSRCIRCFCCQELCPEGALLTRQGLLLRLNRFIHGG